MSHDDELAAMGAILSAMEPLTPDQRSRVFSWASERLSISVRNSEVRERVTEVNTSDAAGVSAGSFSEFHSLFDAAAPKSEVDRALVGGYWFQVGKSLADFSGQQVNDELKQLGHPVSNITKAFDRLQDHKPVLARQIQKAGKSKQGRKRYRITQEGIARVKSMIDRRTDGEERPTNPIS